MPTEVVVGLRRVRAYRAAQTRLQAPDPRAAMHLVTLSGSPSLRSRSGALLQLALERVAAHAEHVSQIAVRTLPPEALLDGRADASPLREAVAQVGQADLLIVATPIYKAAYSGLLKCFLDLLPPDALRGTTVLPLATGGSPGHLLALDYALKPVLSALGARDVLDGVFATDIQLVSRDGAGYAPDAALLARLDRALGPVFERWSATVPGAAPVSEGSLRGPAPRGVLASCPA